MSNPPFVFTTLHGKLANPSHINFDCKGATVMGLTLVWLSYDHKAKQCIKRLARTIDGMAIWTQDDEEAEAIIQQQVIKRHDGWRLMVEVVAWNG